MKINKAQKLKFLHTVFAMERDLIVGGQAVMEGVMMRAPHSYCVAVRKANALPLDRCSTSCALSPSALCAVVHDERTLSCLFLLAARGRWSPLACRNAVDVEPGVCRGAWRSASRCLRVCVPCHGEVLALRESLRLPA